MADINQTGVSITYSVVMDICSQMQNVINDIDEQWQRINRIVHSQDSVWQGMAASKFFDDLKSKNEKYMESTTSSSILGYIEAVRELVDANKSADQEITSEQITKIEGTLPTLESAISNDNTDSLNTELLDSVQSDNSVESSDFTENTESLDTGLIDSVQSDNNVTEVSASLADSQLDSELLQSVSSLDNIESSVYNVDSSSSTDTSNIDSVINNEGESDIEVNNNSDDFEYTASSLSDSTISTVNSTNSEE